MNTQLYFKSISIQNLRCFGTEQHVDFIDSSTGKPSMWTVIVGDNGIGKTSILRSIALSVINPDNGKGWKQYIPWNSFARDGAKVAPEVTYKSLIENESAEFSLSIMKGDMVLHDKTNNVGTFDRNLVLFAYGASRSVGNKGITSDSDFPCMSLYHDNAELINVEEWLVQTDYKALKDPVYKQTQEIVFRAIRTLMRDEISDVQILVNKKTTVLFKTDYGWVPFHELSLGYKTFLAWMVDFAKGLIERYPDSKDPLSEPAICLVDEIDLHLHPKLQRDIVKFLTATFTRTQFIVTAHSPLILQSGENGKVILLKKVSDHVEVINDTEAIKNWRVDQILTSDLFGLPSARSSKSENLIKKRRKILSKPELTEGDRKQLQDIEKELGAVPYGESPGQIKAMETIDRLADYLKAKDRNDKNS